MKNNRIQSMLVAVSILFSINVFAEVTVSDAVVRVLPPGIPNTSAYFTIKNNGDKDVALVSANTDVATSAELHAHIMTGEMMSMQKQDQVIVPAGQSIEFAPGGLHVMIFGLKASLKEGQMVKINLITSDNQSISLQAKAVKPGEEKQQHHHH
ncbi:MAG: copper chaperone PCu(A)C [Aliiglaciecola sp.]|uniref:copper chaperone PCu(A)C n=1 Tax=Aliiglaciecola sp. M165 TaxID=2593649 RepID=UPI0021B13B35|nr:copper chaperone PCu(A)C [Aliiglaciecola sp. M165]